MSSRRRGRRRRSLVLTLPALLGLILLGHAAYRATSSGSAADAADPTRREPDVQPDTTGPVPAEATQRRVVRNLGAEPIRWQMPDPVRLQIPAIGLTAPIIPLGLNDDGTLEVPTSFSVTGWFTNAAEPGERGPAVVTGHVDSTAGPGVFYRLRALKPGDDITIVNEGGSLVHFVVTSMRQVPKTQFPTDLVYRQTTRPTLRLITCDGAFDQSTGHYVDNLIVFARLRPTPDSVSSSPSLLPDLRQEAPSDVQLVKRGDRTRLAFASASTNVGAGPLVILGRRSTNTPVMQAEQEVSLASGATEVVPRVGHLHYVVNSTHRHWHLEPFARYELRRASDGTLVGRDAKTGFCLGDRFLSVRLPDSPNQKVYRTNCGKGLPNRSTITEGISVGYGDDYAALLEGQSIDITGLPAGSYYLVHRVNTPRRLVEASYTNNVSWVLIHLTWGQSGAQVEVVDRCVPLTQPNPCATFGA
jgi:hypothetical protein